MWSSWWWTGTRERVGDEGVMTSEQHVGELALNPPTARPL